MILVTGATGKVGAELVKQLVAAGQSVRALVRDPQKAAKALPVNVELARGDLADAESIEEGLAGANRLFLLSPPTDRIFELESNAIAAAKAAGVGHLVKLSVIGVDPRAKCFYAREHGKAESAIREAGIPFTFVRANFFMQNFLGVADGIKTQGAFYQPGGNQAASHVDIADIAAVAAKVLTASDSHKHQAYLVTGPQSLTFSQIADQFTHVLGKPVKYVNVPRDAAKASMLQGGMPEWQAEAINQLMDDFREGKMNVVSDDVKKLTGREARSFEAFVKANQSTFG
jgi:uncharacterized protein YbjT (DUF2867 family)